MHGERCGWDAFWTVRHHFLSESSHCSNPEVLYGAIAAAVPPSADLRRHHQRRGSRAGRQCLDMSKAYEEAGVDLLLCLVNPYDISHESVMHTIELMGEHVIPKFR